MLAWSTEMNTIVKRNLAMLKTLDYLRERLSSQKKAVGFLASWE